MKKITVAAVTAALTLALAAPAMATKPAYAEAAKPGAQSIVEIVLAEDGEFDVLQAAVIQAGLVGLLNGGRQLTVFAPTDAAFERTFSDSEANIISAIENGDLDAILGDVLGYHVTPGRRTSNSVLAASSYKMLNGDRLTKTELAGAGIAATDLSASNGVIHVINSVLIPS